jgi:hypothetical protein
MSESAQTNGPNYDVDIDADDLLAYLAEMSRHYAEDYVEKRQWWSDYVGKADGFEEARYWMLEALGGRKAVTDAMAQIQPGGQCRNDDGTVAVRAFIRYLTDEGDHAHERSYGPYNETRQADEAETAYAKIISMVRDEYGVGWPRLDDLCGNPLECDLP